MPLIEEQVLGAVKTSVIFPRINGLIDTEQAQREQAGVPGGSRGGTRPMFAYR